MPSTRTLPKHICTYCIRHFTQTACARRRLFHRRDEFEAEVALYRNPVLRRVLPELRRASDNGDGAVRSRSGYVFPPFFILERGITLREWRQQERGRHEVSIMVEQVAQLLAVLHAASYVHRDIKGDNMLYLLHSMQWRLLDLGIVARAGACSALRSDDLGAGLLPMHACSLTTE
jgi:hypothetical protein